MQGLHLTADLSDCGCASSLLDAAATLEPVCLDLVGRHGLTAVATRFHDFHPGTTGMVLLAESHLAVHTWPERASVTIDVYVCNFTKDNSRHAEALLDDLCDRFLPGRRIVHRIERGLEARRGAKPPHAHVLSAPREHLLSAPREHPLSEASSKGAAFSFTGTRLVESLHSGLQQIEVWDTLDFGRLFRLDGRFMTSTRDEFVYHELMTHPAVLAHGTVRRALILGGGDGGSAEELLKHASIERIDLVEIDAEVLRIARTHLPAVHRGSLDDARVQVHVADGKAWLESAADARFDLIVMDLTDPDTLASPLYQPEFLRLIHARLAPDGMLSLHVGSPMFAPDRVRALLATLGGIFPVVRPMLAYIPLYGSEWMIAIAGTRRDPLDADVVERIQAGGVPATLESLQYYDPVQHPSFFALPRYVRDMQSGRIADTQSPPSRAQAPRPQPRR